MSKIRVLSEVLANKIAAGEVVERPASVAKELVENALDAGAKRVDVELVSAGRQLIRVADDGEGMTRDDAILAFERHATSKLRTAEDLSAIVTFGFRGEALPSIASVSRLTLTTRLASDPAGTSVTVNGGRLGDVRDVAWPGGTEVAVRDLFFNMPARRKFLKSDATETYHVANMVTHYALANPDVAFSFVNNGRETIRVSPVETLRERAYQLLGSALVDRLVEIEGERDGIAVSGYASNPQEQRTTREGQYLFVNGRYVRDRLLGRAIAEGYRSMMPSGTYPAALLFVRIPTDRVDVNVHPAKIEVRFRDEPTVRQVVSSAIRDALDRATRPVVTFPRPEQRGPGDPAHPEPPASRYVTPGDAYARPRPPAEQPPLDMDYRFAPGGAGGRASTSPPPDVFASPGAAAGRSPEPPRASEPYDESTYASDREPDGGVGPQPPADFGDVRAAPGYAPASQASPSPGVPSNGCSSAHRPAGVVRESAEASGERIAGHIHPLGQIRESFIVATDEEGLLLIDQHVAHERVLFEKFRDARREGDPPRQRLLLPETIDLTPAQAAAFDRLQPELESAGFDVLALSGRTVAISSVPAELPPGDARTLLVELLEAVETGRGRMSLEAMREEIAASLACRAAIKINMPLTAEKMRWLVDQLMEARNPWTCPHGRPIILRYAIRDIERQFQRP